MQPEPTSPSENRPSHVRYQILAIACCLALLTYINRLGFGVAASNIKKDLGLNDEEMGYLASAFLVAYALFQVPGGWLGDRFGGRRLLTVLVMGWSLLSGATAFGLFFPAGAASVFLFLLVLRFLFGMFQAAEFPTVARIMADWMPVKERGSAQGMIWMFSRLGGALVPFLFTGMLWLFGTWATPFWVMAGLGLLWCAGFWPWFRDQPAQMRGVNRAEQELIASGRLVETAPPAAVPWSTILGSVDVWALCLMYGFVGFAGNFFTNMMPLYLRDYRRLAELEFTLLSALPLAAGIGSCALGGLLSDFIIRRWGDRKWGRRLNGMIGLAVAALATLVIPWIGGVWPLAFLLSAAFFCNDMNMGPAWASCADIGERYTGIISGAMNMVGSLAGAAGTAFAGFFFKRGQHEVVFVVYACSYALAVLCWLGVDATRPLAARSVSKARSPGVHLLAADSCKEV
jgi:sugar phosphate permease